MRNQLEVVDFSTTYEIVQMHKSISSAIFALCDHITGSNMNLFKITFKHIFEWL
jgi:hypothetical protein